MKLWVLLGLCLLLVYLRTQIRERLEPIDPIIKAPGPEGGYDEAEMDRIWLLMPEDVHRQFLAGGDVANPYELLAGKRNIARVIGEFYTRVYASATDPITESQLSTWVETRYGEEEGWTPYIKELIVKALKLYFIDQAPVVPPPPPPPTTDVTTIPAAVEVLEEPVPAPTPSDTPEPAERRLIPGAPVTVTIEIHPDGTTHVTNPRAGARGIRAEQSATRDV